MKVNRGEVYFVDLGDIIGSEQGGTRPCVIVQNNVGNTYSPTTIISTLTTQLGKAKLPTHVIINVESDTKYHTTNFQNSLVMCEQIRTIDKRRLKEKIGMINETTMRKIDKAIAISLHVINL